MDERVPDDFGVVFAIAGAAVHRTLEAKVIGNKQLALRFAAAVAVASLVGASAFAESRPSNETRGKMRDRVVERNGDRNRAQRGDDSPNRARAAESSIEVRGNRSSGGRIERDRTQQENRGDATYRRGDSQRESRTSRDRSDRDRSRNNGTWRDHSRNNDSRNDSRSRGTYRDNRYRNDSRYGSRYGNRSPFRYSGRVHRVYPYGGGYRVWLTGCQYPFYIPAFYYNRSRFRVGVSIALGGYYNSRGYYDYYDGYDDGYYDNRTSRGELRGVVESVDYRRETFVVRNEATGSFVTVVMRDRGRDPVRSGDYVELGGDWTRSGLFEAYRVDIVDYDNRR
jgi:hypothetical protein